MTDLELKKLLDRNRNRFQGTGRGANVSNPKIGVGLRVYEDQLTILKEEADRLHIRVGDLVNALIEKYIEEKSL